MTLDAVILQKMSYARDWFLHGSKQAITCKGLTVYLNSWTYTGTVYFRGESLFPKFLDKNDIDRIFERAKSLVKELKTEEDQQTIQSIKQELS